MDTLIPENLQRIEMNEIEIMVAENETTFIQECLMIITSLKPCLPWAFIWIIGTWIVLPKILNHFAITRKWYSKEETSTQLYLCATCVAAIHGAIAAVVSIYAVFYTELSFKDVKSQSSILENQYYITAGYFISDTIQLVQPGNIIRHKSSFIIHHLVCFLAMALAVRTGTCHYFIALKMMTEISTPFMNVSIILQTLNRTHERLYILNGHIFYWTFIFSRPVMLPAFWYQVFDGNTVEVLKTHPSFYILFWFGLSAGLDILNLVWGVKISKEYFEKVREIRSKKNQKKLE